MASFPADQDGDATAPPESLLAEIQAYVKAPIREHVSGATLTTFAIGGDIRAVVTVDSESELSAVLKALSAADEKVFVLGNGSNVLIGDSGIDGWVVRLGAGFRGVAELSPGCIRVGGSASFMSLSRKLSDAGWSGLEFAAGIPASIGGAVFMNAGAHGGEICERIVSVSCLLATGEQSVFKVGELPWRYRHSGLPAGCVVTSVELKLVAGDRDAISSRCAHFLAERRARQPLSMPSAGSVFKNPTPELPAGKALELCGMKGRRIGGAVISELHANWIVNPERNATSADVTSLMDLCRKAARETLGIELESEVRVW